MDKNWFKKQPKIPEEKEYFIVEVYEEKEDPLDAAWGEIVKVSKEEYLSTEERLQSSVRTVSEAVIFYEIIERILEKHIYKTTVDQYTKDGKLNSLARASKSYLANYDSLIDILNKQIASSDKEVSEHAKEYKESLPTVSDINDILESISIEKSARLDKRTMIVREIKDLHKKIEDNLDDNIRFMKEINSLKDEINKL